VSKYEPLWKHLQTESAAKVKLTFTEIRQILGFEIDHSFLNFKKEAPQFGYTVERVSLKEKNVMFSKIT
jgi:hypothetical protein